jgi:hypothetical protein
MTELLPVFAVVHARDCWLAIARSHDQTFERTELRDALESAVLSKCAN